MAKKEEKNPTNIPPSILFLFLILYLALALCSFLPPSLSVSLTKAAVSSKMRPRTEGMQMKSLLVD